MLKQNKKRFFTSALIFFLLLNLGAVFFSWQGRNLPPEPDDTGVFLTLLQGHKNYSSVFSSEFKVLNKPFLWDETGGVDKAAYFSWAFFWGKIARLFSLKATSVLQLSFYSGVILFLSSVLYFFKEKDWVFKTILILTLALFTGEGVYHGLFWPTPSLYAVCLFLLIFKLLFSKNQYWWLKLCFLLPTFLLAHPLSFISLFSLPVYFLLSFIFSKKKEGKARLRVLSLFLGGLLLYFGWFELLRLKGINLIGHTNLLYFTLTKLLEAKTVVSDFSTKVVINNYFIPLLTRPFFLALFILGLINSIKKDRRTVFLLVSFFPLMLIGLFFEGGGRIILFSWVITFFIFSYGLLYLINILKEMILKKELTKDKKEKLLLIFLGSLFLELVWLVFGLQENSAKNIIIKNFLLVIKIPLICVVLFSLKNTKKLVFALALFGIFSFTAFLIMEKSAMVIFQRQKANFSFDQDLFLSQIDPLKKGLIIYNGNMSFAFFSSQGLLDREGTRKGYLREGELNKAAYFITTRSKFQLCQEEKCWFKESGIERQMKRKAADDRFLLYEF